MRIGYACTPLGTDKKTTRKFLIKNFNEENFKKAAAQNIEDLISILEYNVKNNIYLFRISSDIIPFGSHKINQINWQKEYKNILRDVGNYINKNNIRVSMHPGQYTVLNSNREDVVLNSIRDLEYHCSFLDSLEIDYHHRIELHVGGIYGDKSAAMQRFIDNFRLLTSSLSKRLTIENDDKSYTIEDVLMASEALSIPAIFDNLHNEINPSLIDLKNILRLVNKTYIKEKGPMLLHYSQQDNEKKTGSHSSTIDTAVLYEYLKSIGAYDFDIILEVKDKDLSVIKYLTYK